MSRLGAGASAPAPTGGNMAKTKAYRVKCICQLGRKTYRPGDIVLLDPAFAERRSSMFASTEMTVAGASEGDYDNRSMTGGSRW